MLPYAKRLNIDYVWVHGAATVLEATFAHSLNMIGTSVLVVEMGVGMRMTKEYCKQLVDGIFVEMKDLGMWQGEVITPKDPLIFTDGEVHYLNAGYAGIFLPTVEHWTNVKKGDKIGEILDPLESVVKEELYSECDGILFTLREYPVVSEGSLIGRILERQAGEWKKFYSIRWILFTGIRLKFMDIILEEMKKQSVLSVRSVEMKFNNYICVPI